MLLYEFNVKVFEMGFEISTSRTRGTRVNRSVIEAPTKHYMALQTVHHRFNIEVAVLPWRYDVEMDSGHRKPVTRFGVIQRV